VLRQGAGRLRARRRLAARRCLRLKLPPKPRRWGLCPAGKPRRRPSWRSIRPRRPWPRWKRTRPISRPQCYYSRLRSLWSRSPLTTSRVSSLGSYGLVRRYLRKGFRLWDLLVSFAVTYVKGFVPGITSRVSSLRLRPHRSADLGHVHHRGGRHAVLPRRAARLT